MRFQGMAGRTANDAGTLRDLVKHKKGRHPEGAAAKFIEGGSKEEGDTGPLSQEGTTDGANAETLRQIDNRMAARHHPIVDDAVIVADDSKVAAIFLSAIFDRPHDHDFIEDARPQNVTSHETGHPRVARHFRRVDAVEPDFD